MTVARVGSVMRMGVAGLPLAALLACGNAPAVDEDAASPQPAAAAAESGESADLASLRSMAAPFENIDAARAAGYTEQITPCWYHSERGGQGIHIARQEWIDGNVSLLEPELTMYEPQADGSMQFLAVEYIVPFAAWTQPEPPVMLGQTFMRNEGLGLYVLHVWLGRENPSGIYADFNPAASCEHAQESEDRA